MPLEESLNEQNNVLLEKLRKIYKIEFEIDPSIPSWQVGNSYKISAPSADINPAAMAHELLHIDLDLKGFADNIYTYTLFNSKVTAFSPEFIGPMNNNLAHFKMIDDFVQMGYPVDSFLQDTPKQYFLKGMIYKTIGLRTRFEAGALELSQEILEIIHLITGTKLFELYNKIDPTISTGLHPDLVLGPLKEINFQLVTDIENLVEEWKKPEINNNIWFFSELDKILKAHGIPNYEDCQES